MYVCMYRYVQLYIHIIHTYKIYIYKGFIKLAYTEIVITITVIVAYTPEKRGTWQELGP